jgi:uncharacterized protein (TIGR01777 family)
MTFEPSLPHLDRDSRDQQPLRVLLSGAGGLIGSALQPVLTAAGHEVVKLVRRTVTAGEAARSWDPATGQLDPASLAGFQSIIHLAGEPIVGRWSKEKKRRIRNSRVGATGLLARSLASLPSPPESLLCASAIGIYGDRGDEELDEHSRAGEGFLADVGREWEAATEPAARAGIRVVHLRFGVVLSSAGGALAKMLPPFRAGLGGRLGNGRQYMSWVTLDDAASAIHHILTCKELSGAVNVVAPQPVTNREFTASLGRALSRPALLPVPAVVLRILLGEMAGSLLLAGARVLPRKLMRHGYRFRHAGLEEALRHLLERQD